MHVAIGHYLGISNIHNLNTAGDSGSSAAITSCFAFYKNVALVKITVHNPGRCMVQVHESFQQLLCPRQDMRLHEPLSFLVSYNWTLHRDLFSELLGVNVLTYSEI